VSAGRGTPAPGSGPARSPRGRRPLLLAALAAAALSPLPGAAQLGLERPGAGAGAYFERFSFAEAGVLGIESLSLLTLPFAGRADVAPRFTILVSGAWARGALTRSDGTEQTLAGLIDTEVRATYGLGSDALTLSAVALLPTGHSTLDGDEADVAGAVAADVLPFRISNWGTGGGFGASVAAATQLGRGASAGISFGYVLAREFEPVADRSDYVYRPGNQLHVTGALDAGLGGSGKGSLRVSFQRFDTDRANDVNLYQSGNRIQVTGSYAFAAGASASGIVYAGIHHRDRAELGAVTIVAAAQDLILAGVGGRLPLGRGVIQPALDLRVLEGADDAPRGYTAGLGLTGEWPAGTVLVAPTVRVRTGNAQTPAGAETGYTGVELGIAVRFGSR
jgi:hypothetical protein